MAKCVSVLEEALGIKSVLSYHFTEVLNDLLAQFPLGRICRASSIDCVGAYITYGHIKVLFEALLCKDFVHTIGKLSPLNMVSLFRRLEHSFEHFKFAS